MPSNPTQVSLMMYQTKTSTLNLTSFVETKIPVQAFIRKKYFLKQTCEICYDGVLDLRCYPVSKHVTSTCKRFYLPKVLFTKGSIYQMCRLNIANICEHELSIKECVFSILICYKWIRTTDQGLFKSRCMTLSQEYGIFLKFRDHYAMTHSQLNLWSEGYLYIL